MSASNTTTSFTHTNQDPIKGFKDQDHAGDPIEEQAPPCCSIDLQAMIEEASKRAREEWEQSQEKLALDRKIEEYTKYTERLRKESDQLVRDVKQFVREGQQLASEVEKLTSRVQRFASVMQRFPNEPLTKETASTEIPSLNERRYYDERRLPGQTEKTLAFNANSRDRAFVRKRIWKSNERAKKRRRHVYNNLKNRTL